MIYLLTGLLVLINILLMLIWGTLLDVRRSERDNLDEIRELRLTSRARLGRAEVQTGATSVEQKLVRLGRVSAGRRVVVGGDDDSELNRLMRGLGDEEEAPQNG